ncbi:MAG TPA: PTS transporter subunit EIIC, partial [Atopostipes sp.]|nr:PTS transporter subunit EIIC [Atopostipes sp.]
MESNQTILDSGKTLTVENGAHIVTDQFTAVFVNLTGTGITLGLVLYMVLFAKSKQYKELGKLSLIPSLFNINEPVIFGTPIVLNPFLLIPFVLTPTLVGLLMYGAIYFGLVPPFSGITVPWTTPPVISGFLLGGWRTALSQVIIILISFLLYFPFVRKADLINLKNESNKEV